MPDIKAKRVRFLEPIGWNGAVFQFLKYILWDIDEPPDRIGPIGLAIMGVFLLFCAAMLFYHSLPHVAK